MPPDLVQRDRERLTRVRERRDVGEQGAGVDVHRVAAGGLHDRHAGALQPVAEVGGGPDAVAQVVVVDDLAQPLRDGLEVTAGEPAVGGEALGEDEQVAAALGQVVVAHGEPAADVGQAVLLGAHRHAVGERRHLPHDVGDVALGLAGLALADEPGVLGEAAGVEEQRHRRRRSQSARTPRRFSSETGWPPPELLVTVTNTTGMSAAALRQQRVEALEVHVPLERVEGGRVEALGDHEVDRLGAGGLDVGPGGVEVGVVRDDRAGPGDHGEQDLLGGAALVRGDHVREREQLLHGLEEPEPRRRAGVALVAALDARPLVPGHRAGAGVGEQVDQHVLGAQREQVVARLEQRSPALLDRGHPQRLDRVDPERLDDRLERHAPIIARAAGRAQDSAADVDGVRHLDVAVAAPGLQHDGVVAGLEVAVLRLAERVAPEDLEAIEVFDRPGEVLALR